MKWSRSAAFVMAVFGLSALAWAGPTVTVEHREEVSPGTAFQFEKVPSPAKDSLAKGAKVEVISGTVDPASAGVEVLTDGKLPDEEDAPGANFFFAPDTSGGRVRIDLGSAQGVAQVNTYSWHGEGRAPQVYKLYAAAGTEAGFSASPDAKTDPAKAGWKLLADVKATPKKDEGAGGQYAVSVADGAGGALGTFRYVLLDIARTSRRDPFAETFFSEVSVVAVGKTVKPQGVTTEPASTQPDDGKYEITLDPTGLNDDMKAWANGKLLDTCKEWYPKLVKDLPSAGFKAPKKVNIRFRPDSEMKGTPAYTGGTTVTCNIEWYTKQKEGEAVGATIHELVHVVQQYHFGRRNAPFWLQEGIPDYLRWYTFEPEKHGCVIRKVTKDTNYDKAYRTSANFLDWATLKYDKDLVMKINAAVRGGKYTPDIWPTLCKGKTIDQLNADWKAALTTGTAESNK